MFAMWVKRERFEQLKEHLNKLLLELKEVERRPFLLDIEQNGRRMVFTFVRCGEVFQVETMSLMSDNIKKWKDDLLR